MFSDEFLDSLPEDVPLAVLAFCDEFSRRDREVVEGEPDARTKQFRLYADSIAAFAAFCSAKGCDYTLPDITELPERNVFAGHAIQLFKRVRESVEPEIERRETADYAKKTQQRFDGRFGAAFSYEFSDDEVERIQSLINELVGVPKVV